MVSLDLTICIYVLKDRRTFSTLISLSLSLGRNFFLTRSLGIFKDVTIRDLFIDFHEQCPDFIRKEYTIHILESLR